MYQVSMNPVPTLYKNHGQESERQFSIFLGSEKRADNVRRSIEGDIAGIQVKSARATVHDDDPAETYAYVIKNFTKAYIMNRAEFATFVKEFATVTHDSDKNGGKLKKRLRYETPAMLAWLARKV